MSERGNKDIMEMEIDELVREYATAPVLASQLPDKIKGTIDTMDLREDKRGRKCLFMRLRTNEGTTVIKYTPSMLPILGKAFKDLGFTKVSEVIGCTFLFERKATPRGFPRHFPVKLISRPGSGEGEEIEEI